MINLIIWLLACAALVGVGCSAKGNSPQPMPHVVAVVPDAQTADMRTVSECDGFVLENYTKAADRAWCPFYGKRQCLTDCYHSKCARACAAYVGSPRYRDLVDCLGNEGHRDGPSEVCDALFPEEKAAADAFWQCTRCSCDTLCGKTNRQRCSIQSLPNSCYQCEPEGCVVMCESFNELPYAYPYTCCIRSCGNSNSCIRPCELLFSAEHAKFTAYSECLQASCPSECGIKDTCALPHRRGSDCADCVNALCKKECDDGMNVNSDFCVSDDCYISDEKNSVCNRLFPDHRAIGSHYRNCVYSKCPSCANPGGW